MMKGASLAYVACVRSQRNSAAPLNIAASAINVSELMDLPCFRPPGPVPMECDGPPRRSSQIS